MRRDHKPAADALDAVSAVLDGSIAESELTAMLARADAATEGPWRECGADGGTCICGQVWSASTDLYLLSCVHRDDEVPTPSLESAKANARFIAHARTDVVRLVAALRAERLRK